MSESTPRTFVARRADAVLAGDALLERVERARADVAEHDAEGADHQGRERARHVAMTGCAAAAAARGVHGCCEAQADFASSGPRVLSVRDVIAAHSTRQRGFRAEMCPFPDRS